MKKLLLSFATVAIAVASAASNSFKVTIEHTTFVGGTELKAGEYKVQAEGDKITLTLGKNSPVITVPAKMETADKKFDATTLRVDGKQKLEEIRVGGTNMRIVFPGVTAD
jgi:lipopolysaccharide export system protein LptA